MPEGVTKPFSTIAFTDSSFSLKPFMKQIPREMTGTWMSLIMKSNQEKLIPISDFGTSFGPLFRSLALSTPITTVTFSRIFKHLQGYWFSTKMAGPR